MEQETLASPNRARQFNEMPTSEIKRPKVYNLAEIDMQLEFLANLLMYAKYNDRSKCLVEVDKWLDRRNRLTTNHGR